MSLYEVSIPVFLRGLNNLTSLLQKGEAHALEKGIAPDVLLQAQLAPDMFSLVRQVQSVSDSAKAGGARLAGVPVPSFADTETTFADLYERIAKTVQFLEGVKPADVDGDTSRQISLKMRAGEFQFTQVQYLTAFALPNFFFHIATAYDVMRNQGVPLVKMDYLGNLDFSQQ